jgi:large subunit ribosomal protein L35
MPKLKTHKGAAARFHITGTGKVLRVKGGKSHLRRKKRAEVRRLFDGKVPVSPSVEKRLQRMLPYGN